MEKTTNLKVRLLALALTALMVVGMLPMSVFAISAKPADSSAPTTEYRKADISDVIDSFYEKDARYWTLIYKDTESGTQATTTYGGTSTLDKRNTATFANGVLTVPGDSSGNAQYRNINTQYNNVKANLFNKNLGGLDVAVKLQLKVDASMDEVATEGTSSIGMGFDLCAWGAQNHVLGVIKTSGEVGARKYELYAYDGTTKLCDLSSTEYVTVEALCDVGAFGGAMYIYINGEFVYSVNLSKTCAGKYNTINDLAHQASLQASWGDYTKGPLFGGFICAAGTAGYNVKNMSAFYYDDTPEDGDVTNAARETNIAYYNSFDESVDNVVNSGIGAGYMQQRVGTRTIENGEIAFKTILDKTAYKLSINTYVQAYDANTKTYKANSGKSFVYQLDYKLGDVVWEGTLATFACNTIDSSTDNGTIAQANPVTMDGDCKVFAGGKQIATLSADKYTTIGYAVNVADNTVDVYVDGILAAEGVTFLDDKELAKLDGVDGFENGFALSFIGLYREASGDQHNGTAFYYDNVMLYYSDSYITNTIKPDKTDASYTAPTGAEIETALGANGTLLYYNDYNSATKYDNAGLNASVYKQLGNGIDLNGNPGQIVDDANGGKALHLHNNGSSPTNYTVYGGGYRAVTSDYQGRGFVVSADFKMNGAITAGSLMAITMYIKYNTALTSLPVWVDTDGTLYVSNPDNLTSNGGSITGGLVYEVNKIDNGGLTNNGGGKKGTKIGKLSSDEFTNIAVQVKDNKLSVYVNGECKVSDLLFMSDSAKAYVKANKDASYTSNEFALNAMGFGWRGQNTTTATHNMINDNVTMYISDTFIKGTTEITSLYDAEKQTGYKYEKGGIYYYENGALVKNTVSADGILTIDANGQVFFGDTAVTSMGDYYKYVGNEIVPKDGFYSGIYRGNMLLGANEGSYYCFDTDKNLVTGKTVYDITEDGVTLGYAIDANGVIGDLYSGMATLDDGVCIYANGVRKTGFIEYNEKNYFANENGYLVSGEKTIEGYVWDFDANTFEGSKRDGLWIVNEGEDDEYANLYILGELQTIDSEDGELLTHDGKTYYISAGETSKLCKGNGVVMINSKPYGFDGYVATLISDAVYNGYYYNESGEIVKAEFFFGKNKAGASVVYHADALTGALIAGGIEEFNGWWYSFNAVDADEPYIGIALNGVYKIGENYRYFVSGELFKNGVCSFSTYTCFADANGNLITVTIYKLEADDRYYVNVGDTDAPYKFSKAHGVIKSKYDGENETYRYFVYGELKTEDVSFGEESSYFYIILENGDLAVNSDSNRPMLYKGKWYLKYAETEYALVLADGIYVISDNASAEYAGKRKLFRNGEIVAGDANGEIFDNASLCYKYDEKGSLYCNNDDGVVCADGKTYDFDENCVATLRTGYNTSKDGFVWVDGKKVTDGIHFVPVEGGGEIEMYFKDGKASAGEIVVEDGSVHKFGEDGKRYIEEGATEPEDKYPHSIVIITYVKDGDTTTELARREIYRFWHNSFSYTPYYFCYGYTITVNGTEITAANGELLKVYIEANDENDHVIIVTFDKSTDCHIEWVKDGEQCTSATCKQGGIDVYVCNVCGRNGRKEVNTPVDESKHSFTVNIVDATHTTMGTRTTTCENGCDYCKVEYLPMLAHEWTEVEGSRVAPTCGVNGSVSYSCTCGATKTETLKATGLHNYVLNGYKEPTCAVDGSVNYVCSECQGTYSIKLPATCKHTHGEDDPYTVISDKSEDYETRIYDCNVCGKVGAIAETVSVTSDEEK